MYNYIIGKITRIETSYIVLENNNIGYQVQVGNPFSFKYGEEYKVYIYTQIKEDEHLLYGFKEIEDKDLFLRLISVKGLGPKMALPLLATGNINSIFDAIERENILYLKKFPKIGDKVAKQIILDLKGKLAKLENIKETNEELISALENLGYKKDSIKKVAAKVDTSLSIENQIKEALRLLLI